MTTQSWSARIRHDSDATFREWGSDFAARLAAVGLVQESDTGQVNWTTVTRPGSNTEGGFEIWRFDDTEQGTAPIFMRIGYGTAAAATAPRIQITVGTGSNGSGTITGTALTITRSINGSTGQATDTARQSYMCAADGFFGVNWKVGASNTEGGFFICRTCDSDGVPTPTGAMVRWSNGAASQITATQALRFAATAAAFTAQAGIAGGALGISPQIPTNTNVGSDIQVMLAWTITPRVEPLFGVCGVYSTELTAGGTFTTTLVGTTPRTYLSMNSATGPFGPETTANLFTAMLWE